MKKIVILILALALSLPLFAFAPVVHAANSSDPRVSIEIERDGTNLMINHTSGLSISYAVIEYAYMEDGTKYAQLTQLPVTNNKNVTIDASWIALKVHQVKVYKDRTYYTYMTDNKNKLGDMTGLTRINITEIETVATKVVPTTLDIEIGGGGRHKYYEFYFNFDKQHDELIALDVEYVMVKKPGWWEFWKETTRQRMTNTFAKFFNQTIHGYVKQLSVWVDATQTIKTLEENTNKEIASNYVLRIAPSGTEGFTIKDYYDYGLENMAIIRVKYLVNGEFIVDDVIKIKVKLILLR